MGDRNEPLREEKLRYYGEIVNMGEYVIVGVRLCRWGPLFSHHVLPSTL